jgi:hypothetical protein
MSSIRLWLFLVPLLSCWCEPDKLALYVQRCPVSKRVNHAMMMTWAILRAKGVRLAAPAPRFDARWVFERDHR